MPRRRPATAAELGLMLGAPPFAADRLVTLDNWQEPPFNRWGFQHVRDLIPTARVPRGDGPVWRLARAERDLSSLELRAGRRRLTLGSLLDETYTDGFLVLHRGRIVFERYANGLTPDATHLLMSVSKSITSTVAGILVGRGVLSASDLVTAHVPELSGTSFEGCTVRHLLDMRAGTRFDEDYDSLEADVRVYEQVYLWRPRTRDLPPDATSYFATLSNAREHGGRFEYRSILTDVLGWVVERAGGARLPELIARELWQPMGAEFDAEITVEAHGNAMADGGMCCALRDLARFGLLMSRLGRRGREPIVPDAWIRDTLTPDRDSVDALRADQDSVEELGPGGYYRNQWWVASAGRPSYYGAGINGQLVLIEGPDVVIAKLSTWPQAWSAEYALPTLAACRDLARRLAADDA